MWTIVLSIVAAIATLLIAAAFVTRALNQKTRGFVAKQHAELIESRETILKLIALKTAQSASCRT